MVANQQLWPLLPIVDVTCSDDETEVEISAIKSSPGDKNPIIVRHLAWRKGELDHVWKRLDSCRTRHKQSLTASTTSSPRGRRSRPRRCIENAPASKILAPENLPIDCYSTDFLNSLTSKQKAPLNIDPKPVLPAILMALDKLGL